MRTPAQRRNLRILRDEILPGIPEGELRMRGYFNACGTPSCLLGHACYSGRFNKLWKSDGGIENSYGTFGLSPTEWQHIFGCTLPNDPTWLAANITDLIESEE